MSHSTIIVMTMAVIIIAINEFNIYSKIDTLYNELIKFNL